MTKKKIKTLDAARAARKLQEERDGKRIISDSSAPPLRHYALFFEDQYTAEKSRAGSSKEDKRDQGIWLAVKEIRESSPDMDAEAVWNNLDGYRTGTRWALDVDGEYVHQSDLDKDKTKKIKYGTFVRHYYSEVLKK